MKWLFITALLRSVINGEDFIYLFKCIKIQLLMQVKIKYKVAKKIDRTGGYYEKFYQRSQKVL